MSALPAVVSPRLPAPFRAPYAPDDATLVRTLLDEVELDAAAEARIDAHATRLIEAIRGETGGFGVEEFLREYSLTTREGLALMVLAEALLRVPDAATADRLIEDKLAEAQFENHERVSDAWLVAASAWAMGLHTKIFRPGETPTGILSNMIKRMGRPTVRTAARQAMRVMGHQFVLGETIDSALSRAAASEAKGYRHSYDMLGEGARSQADAEKYFASYAAAIERIGQSAGPGKLPARPGISVKLSALHPRYEATNGEAVMRELVPRLIDLARMAKGYDLNFTVDAEEADRLELSLDVFAAVLADPSLAGWDGFGLAIQAYQKRALAVVEWIGQLAESLDRRLMVRLVKGAYWDTEMKRAQERGLADYPLFSRKAATDLSYLACAKRLLALRPRIYSQFAGHNALTVAQVAELAGVSGPGDQGFEYQKLHGMGDALHRAVVEGEKVPCRIYAPCGGHRDLLAYLVRRLLENGANSSFVAKVGDASVEVAALLTRPGEILADGAKPRHARIPLPKDLFGGTRANSRGLEFGFSGDRIALETAIAAERGTSFEAAPVIDGRGRPGTPRPVVSPVDGASVVGSVSEATVEIAAEAMAAAAAAFPAWERTPVAVRAEALDTAADALEAHRERLMALLAMEAGKTLGDGLAEVREAIDFCRYYAQEARRQFGEDKLMPGPTGEENRLRHRGRGVFVCISPWNFPLAIFMGQIAAALAAGNTVVAKPAEQTPLTGALAVKILHEAGIPVGALQFVPGDGLIGAALIADARVAGVAFTGSTEVARIINRTLAAKNGPIVPLIAETGGINAMIVDATALPEQVADDVVMSAFRSAGQRCSALRLLFVQEDVADRMIEMITGAAAALTLGDPRRLVTDVGPVIDAEAKSRLDAHVAKARAEGRVVWEGAMPTGAFNGGTWVAPTVIRLDRAEDLEAEQFGPVLHVVRWKADALDAVIGSIAASGYGLTLGVHSRIEATIRRVTEKLSVGNVYVNRNMIGAVVGVQPFGGSGLSGTGPKAGGPEYLCRFALEQTISTNTAAAGGNASLLSLGEE